MNERLVTLGDGRALHVRSVGQGDRALVCIHGLAQSSYLWQHVIARLPADWCGHAVDLPGFGDSPEAHEEHSIAVHAAYVHHFIRTLPHSRIVLAANSLGGVVAMTLAADHGELLAGLVLVGTGPRVRDPHALTASRHRWTTMTLDAETRRTIARRYTFNEQEAPIFDRLAADVGKARRAAVLETMDSSLNTDMTGRLAEINVPALVVQGLEDTGRPPADGLALVRGIRDSRLLVLPSVGHTPMLEASAEFERWLHQFLRTLA